MMSEAGKSGIFAIGDLHLSFSTEKPMDIFGDRWKQHHTAIEKNWRRAVRDGDIVLIVGDVSWALKYDDAAADLEWVRALPGKKILIRGNHDLWWSGISRLRDDYPDIAFIQNDACVIGGTAFCGSRGWLCPGDPNFAAGDDKIYKRELIRLRMSLESARRTGAPEIVAGLHYPPMAGNGLATGFTDLFEEYGVKTLAYGHLHGGDAFKKAFIGDFRGVEYRLVSADFADFCPLRIGEAKEAT